jgi:hypothetical protein
MKKIMTSYEKISDKVKSALIEKYPDGFEDKIVTHQDLIRGGTFKGILFEMDDASYLIKFQSGDYNSYLEDVDEEEEENYDTEPNEDFEE